MSFAISLTAYHVTRARPTRSKSHENPFKCRRDQPRLLRGSLLCIRARDSTGRANKTENYLCRAWGRFRVAKSLLAQYHRELRGMASFLGAARRVRFCKEKIRGRPGRVLVR